MKDRQDFDMKRYIEKRMLEIENLDDRRLFKKVIGEILMSVYDYNEKAYSNLEQRILNECSPSQNRYAVYTCLTDIQHFDATDTFMHPMRPDDVKKTEISYQEIQTALEKKEYLKLYTVFLQGSASQIYELLSQKERRFRGTIKTEKREYQAEFCVKQNTEYMDMIERLYYIFGANYQPWLTVCTAYLKKMLDVYLCSAERMRGKEDILEIKVDFEEYSRQIHYDMVPLWNLRLLTEKTSTYPAPSIDKVNYEHQIFSQRLDSQCEYLIRNTDIEITNIRRLNGDLYITCPMDQPCEWQMYQVDRMTGKENYRYPVLSNQFKDSFSGSITEMFRKSIKTRGEMGRLIESFDYGEYVTFMDFHIYKNVPRECISANYSMDAFIEDEIRSEGLRQVMVIDFSVREPEYYLNEDIMSFLVTQVQKIFPEYHCYGRLS